jgi:molecular chaperone GrpE
MKPEERENPIEPKQAGDASENGASGATGEVETPQKPTGGAAENEAMIDELKKERDLYYDQLQRSRAEFANYQLRAKNQADIDRQYMIASLVNDLLEVLDNFERALAAAKAAGSGPIVEGMDMVSRQLMSVLSKHGVEPIVSLGEPFDPARHEALVQQPDSTHPEGTVVAELIRGYSLKDRVIRPAKVAVSIKP